jgi:hypothetical protein
MKWKRSKSQTKRQYEKEQGTISKYFCTLFQVKNKLMEEFFQNE